MKVLVLSMQDDPRYVREAFAAGASGYVLKEAADTEVVDAIREVARGGRYVHPELGARLVAAEAEERRRAEENPLSEREREVLRLLALGHTNQEIAKKLYISVRTAETHRAHIMQKLRLATRAELVRYALAQGMLETVPTRRADAGRPARRAAARRVDRLHRDPRADEHPGDERVRRPHLPHPELVAPPHRCRRLRREREHAARDAGVVRQALRGRGRVGDVGNDAVAPAANLVAEEAEAAEPPAPDRTAGDHVRSRPDAPGGRLLDRDGASPGADAERGVEERTAPAPLPPRDDRLVEEAAPPDDVPARAERQPVQVDEGTVVARRDVRAAHAAFAATVVPRTTSTGRCASCSTPSEVLPSSALPTGP